MGSPQENTLRSVQDLQKTETGRAELQQIRTEALAAASKDIPALQKASRDIPKSEQFRNDTYNRAYDSVEKAITGVFNKHHLTAGKASSEDIKAMDKEQTDGTAKDKGSITKTWDKISSNYSYVTDMVTNIQNPAVTKEQGVGSGATPSGPQQSQSRGK